MVWMGMWTARQPGASHSSVGCLQGLYNPFIPTSITEQQGTGKKVTQLKALRQKPRGKPRIFKMT